MPLLRTSVDFVDHFDEIKLSLVRVAERAVTEGAREGAAVAAAIAGERSVTGQMSAIRVEPTRRTDDGFVASFASPVHYSWFQNYGTLGSRRKRLKEAPRTNRTREPGTGISPLRFLDAGRRAGTRAMLEVVHGAR